MSPLKQLLARSPTLKAMAYGVHDALWGVRLKYGMIDTNSGSAHAGMPLDESLRYIETVFHDYKQYGNVTRFCGRIAEIGPGDNAGVALLMLRDGCQHVDMIDRYRSRRDLLHQKTIYEELSKRHRLDAYREGSSWTEENLRDIQWHIGVSAEQYFAECARRQRPGYDFIVSRAVMEHMYDPLGSLESMVQCLHSGGRLLHKIDFRDHGMFTPTNHELAFLNIPRVFYARMVRHSGRPNRILFHEYDNMLHPLKEKGIIDYQLLVTHLVGCQEELIPHREMDDIPARDMQGAEAFVTKHRRNFAREFLHVSNRDLAVAGVFLVITKQ